MKVGSQVGRWRVTAIEQGVSVDWDLTEGPYAGRAATGSKTLAGTRDSRW